MQFAKIAVPLAVLATTFSFAAPAVAQSSADASHWYVGGSFGRSGMKDACDGAAGAGAQCDSDDYAWRVLGGYQFNQNWAVEGGYHNLGRVNFSGGGGPNGDVAFDAWELVGLGMLPWDKWALYGKLGFFRGQATPSSNLMAATSKNNGYTFGAGLQYDFTRQFGGRIEWQQYTDVGGDQGSTVSVFSIGALFRFR